MTELNNIKDETAKGTFITTLVIMLILFFLVLFIYFIHPAFLLAFSFHFLLYTGLIVLSLFIYALTKIKSKFGMLTIAVCLVMPILIVALSKSGVPMRLNYALLRDMRVSVYDLAVNGELKESPNSQYTQLSPPRGRSLVAFDGIELLGPEADDGAIFYMYTGILEEVIEKGFLYKPNHRNNVMFSSDTEVTVINDEWLYFNGEVLHVPDSSDNFESE